MCTFGRKTCKRQVYYLLHHYYKQQGKFADFQNAAYLENWWKTLSNLIQILFKAVDNRTVTMNDMYQTSVEHQNKLLRTQNILQWMSFRSRL